MCLTKRSGSRMTEINVESRKEVTICSRPGNYSFKLTPLFIGQNLNIQNCSIEVEIFTGELGGH